MRVCIRQFAAFFDLASTEGPSRVWPASRDGVRSQISRFHCPDSSQGRFEISKNIDYVDHLIIL